MPEHVKVFCFLACYAAALALEIARLWFRSGIRRAVSLALVVVGWLGQTAFLYYSAKQAASCPLSSYHDWMLLAAWALVLVYFYLACFHPSTHFGIFFLPLVLGLIVAADWFADPNQRFAKGPGLKEVWASLHGVSILAATVTMLFGFAAGMMYLWQAQRLKHRRPQRVAVRLPSLEWLQTANARALVASTLLTGLAVASGIELNRLSGRLTWHNPVVLATLAMFAWLLLHTIVGAFYRPIRQGRKVAYLTVVSFVFLLVALGLALFH